MRPCARLRSGLRIQTRDKKWCLDPSGSFCAGLRPSLAVVAPWEAILSKAGTAAVGGDQVRLTDIAARPGMSVATGAGGKSSALATLVRARTLHHRSHHDDPTRPEQSSVPAGT
jgi:hypothetical protein